MAALVTAAYIPHAFLHFFEHDPGRSLEKLLELVLYNVVGILCGILSDRERKRKLEVRAAQDDERKARLELQRAERLAALGELVAGIAHELKNPLHTLKGTAEVVDRIVPSDKPESEMWTLHREELTRLERVAEQFLSFARPVPPDCRRIAVRDILQRAGELLRPQAARNNISLEIRLEGNSQETAVNVDRDQIVHALIDIAMNGFSAMSGAGSMIISAGTGEDSGKRYAAIRVENDGPRIADEHLEKIFDPFFTTRSEGTGLGLSTTARIVQQHGGTVEAENLADGRGVAFVVRLPAV